ncbi:carboxymuconolactone decarboxylase family protein [Actinomycetospora soli]|uniref:carboxymuconolactone decarboxylase family protein n=1 Tax=Actinomycetospora soli TaxID=2893887 RepID=UPI001E4033A9|nr:carboxymuconolactone decarboxylase family protein [Actinomycetospora soli]MCD2186425.1 carboxymuconolactone decarboxylase family protein [Actinomycetospora soli]
MTRPSRLRPDELDPAGRRVYDAIASGPRAGSGLVNDDGSLRGPFDAMLRNPAVGEPLQAVGAALRYGGQLSDRARELVILRVAGVRESGFERATHEPIARRAGLTDDELAALAADAVVTWPDPVEDAADTAARTLLHHGPVDDDTYRAWVDVLGEARLVEVTALVGYYGLLADLLRVFTAEGSRR